MGKISLGLSAAVLLVLLAGCDGPPSPLTPVPTPSVTPVFASDEEALAAAEASYAAYLAVSDAASADGWRQPELLAEYVTSEELVQTRETYAELAATGRHTQGSSTFDSATLQQFDGQELAIYLCLDVSKVRLVDADGQDVTPLSRPNRIPLEVGFRITESGHLLLSSSDVWDGVELCI